MRAREHGRLSVPITLLLAFVTGCGGSATVTPATAPMIVVQPQNQTFPLGSSATFTVSANGSAPLSYQWSDNGNAISGATSPTLVTSTLAIGNAGDRFTVTVSNSAGSVVSSPAVLTLGPRSPNPHDLRFQHVGFPQALSGGTLSNVSAMSAGSATTSFYPNSVGSGLLVGSLGTCAGTYPTTGNCAWTYLASNTAAGAPTFVSYYAGDQLSNLAAELTKAANTPNAVLTTLDEVPAFGVLAVSVEQDPSVSSGFVQEVDSILPSQLNSLAQQLGMRGYVVTALSGNASGGVDVVSYSYSGASMETYETAIVETDSSSFGPQTADLAANGFILTAVGQNGPNSFLAVGTRLKGDSLPRPFSYGDNTTVVGKTGASAARVGAIYGTNGTLVLNEE